MKKFIFYDLDGTLVDTRRDIADAVNHMRGAFGLTPFPQSAIEPFVGRGIHHLISHTLESQDVSKIEKGFKVYRDYYSAHMLDHSTLYDKTADVLAYFGGRRQYVFTNKPEPYATRILEALGIAGSFDTITAGNGKYPKKPDPAFILAVMAEQGAQAEDVLFVGDSEIDFETGRNAGVLTVLVSHGFTSHKALERLKPDGLYCSFDALLTDAVRQKW